MAKKTNDGGKPRRRLVRELLGIATVLLLAMTARATLADHYRVPTGSMLPTVEVGDRIAVNKSAYGLRVPLTQTWLLRTDEPAAGDVVVLASPVDGETLLKRIVAVPGDLVAVRGGRPWRNGAFAPLDASGRELLGGEPHAVSFGAGGPDFGPVSVPAGSFLVMGDNRGNSLDGRSFGWVRREAVFGRAVGVFARDGRPSWHPL